MDELPADAEGLLAVAPEDFVAERKRVVKELRDAGRTADAEVVAKLRKPPPVVLAVNRAARARPQAAKDAAQAAERVRKTQLGGDPEAYSAALRALDEALELLAEVALAHLDRPSETMRRRLRALLRNAVADDDARAALARGALRTEVETAGFDPFAGMTPAATRKGRARKGDSSRTRAKEEERRRRESALRDELRAAEERLAEATRAEKVAARQRKEAERELAALRTRLDRLA